MGRFNRVPRGVLEQSRSAAERPYFRSYEEGEAYSGDELQSAGEERPDDPEFALNRRYGGEGLTASLGEAALNRHVFYRRGRVPQPLVGMRQAPSMHDQVKDGPFRAAVRTLVYTLRQEYLQNAQRFPGAHTSYAVNISQNTGQPGNRMLPPHRSRLTMRPEPRSYGSMTEKIA